MHSAKLKRLIKKAARHKWSSKGRQTLRDLRNKLALRRAIRKGVRFGKLY